MQTPICCHTNYLYTFQTIQQKYAKIEHAFLPRVKTHTSIVLSLKRLFKKIIYVTISVYHKNTKNTIQNLTFQQSAKTLFAIIIKKQQHLYGRYCCFHYNMVIYAVACPSRYSTSIFLKYFKGSFIAVFFATSE